MAVALPDRTDRVLRDERIGRQEDMFMLDGLADQHAVERVLMERRQLIQIQRSALFKGQGSDAVTLALRRDKTLGRLR